MITSNGTPYPHLLRRHAADPAAIGASVRRAVVADDVDLLRRLLDGVGIAHVLRHCMMIGPLIATKSAEAKTEAAATEGDRRGGAGKWPAEECEGEKIQPKQDDEEGDDDDDESDGDSSGSGRFALESGDAPLEVIVDESVHGNDTSASFEGLEVFLACSRETGDEDEEEDTDTGVGVTTVNHDDADANSDAKANDAKIVETGTTLFHIAAFYGSHQTIRLLAASCRDHLRQQYAAQEQSILLRLLSLPSPEGSTALHIAAFRGHGPAIHAFVQEGVDPNQTSANGTTAAILAASRNHVEALAVLSSGSADLNAADEDGYAPCHAACVSGSVDALRYLFECKRCSDDEDQRTERVVDFTKTTRAGFGCAALAAKHNRADVVEYLSSIHQLDELAPDINQRVMAPDAGDPFNLDPPIHVATKHSSIDALRALLQCRNCDTDARDVQGRTALTLAVAECQVEAVRCLAETVSSEDFELFDAEDVTGMTPLYLASKLGYADIVRILAPISNVKVMCLVEDEEIGIVHERKNTDNDIDEVPYSDVGTEDADPKLTAEPVLVSEGFPLAERTVSQPPLLAAVSHNHVECVRVLLENGADVNQTDDEGHSALSIAARHGFLQLAEVLLSSGADLTLRSYRGGGTALQKARKYRHAKLVELLEKHEMLNDADLEGVI